MGIIVYLGLFWGPCFGKPHSMNESTGILYCFYVLGAKGIPLAAWANRGLDFFLGLAA